MESEDMINLPASSNYGDSSGNNELRKSELGPGEADTQQCNCEGEEGTRDVENFGFNEGDTGTEKGASDLENLGLYDNDMGQEEHATGSENFKVNEVVIKSEKSTIDLQILRLRESDNEIEGTTIQENLGNNGVGALAECTTDRDSLALNQGNVRNADGQFPVETEVDMDLVDSPVTHVKIEVVDTVIVSENLSSFGFAQNGLGSQNESLTHNHMMNGGPVSGVKRARITYDEKKPSVHVTYNSLTRASKRKLEELLQQWSEWHTQHGSSSHESNEVLESGEETYFPALWVGMEKSSAVSFWIENQTKKEQSSILIPPDSFSVPLYDRGFSFGLTSADAPSNVEGGLEIVDEAARCFNCGSYNHSLKECPKPRDNAAVNHARKQRKSRRNPSSRSATRYYQNSPGGKYDGLKPGALDAETRRVLGLRVLDPPPWLNRMRELGYPPGYLDPDDEDQPSGITIFSDENVKEEQEDGEIIETEYPERPRKMAVEFPGINAPIPESADGIVWAAGDSSYDPYRSRPHHRSNHSSEPINRGINSVFSPSTSSFSPRYGNHDLSYNNDSIRGSPSLSFRKNPSRYWSDYGLDYSSRSNDEYDRYESDHHSRRSWR